MSTWYADAWRYAVDAEPGLFPPGSDTKPGRTLARKIGTLRAEEIELQPGSISYRHTSDRDSWACTISVDPLAPDAWDRFMIKIADRPKLAAAVLTGQFPAGLEEPAAEANVSLIPSRVNQLCSCESWDEPCRHAIALAILVADVVEADPFVLVLLLGRSREELVAGVQRARSASGLAISDAADRHPRGPDPTIEAAAAFERDLRPPPRSQPLPRRASDPVPLTSQPPSDSGLSARDLHALVADAASRAVAMLQGDGTAGLHLSPDDDLVRLAARPDADIQRLATAAGADRDTLEARARAWLVGGEVGLEVLDHRWEPAAEALLEAERLFEGRVRRSANAIIAGDVQLRLGEDGSWWRLDANPRIGWELAAGPFEDPADCLENGQSRFPE